MSKIQRLVLAAAAALATQSASAAIQFSELEPSNDAGAGVGSIDLFGGYAASGSFLGQSNGIELEPVNPGVAWTSFTLRLTTRDDIQRNANLTFGGLVGMEASAVDLDPNNNLSLLGWTYTYDFQGPLAANTPHTVNVLSGFSGNRDGLVLLTARTTSIASAIPEPGAPAMLLAGLGALAFVWRRRQP